MGFANHSSTSGRQSPDVGPRIEISTSYESEQNGVSEKRKFDHIEELAQHDDYEKDQVKLALGRPSMQSSIRSLDEDAAEATNPAPAPPSDSSSFLTWLPNPIRNAGLDIWKLLRFVGPGFMVAVAYIDPGNYSTDVSAGASTEYKHLFIVLLSNIFAVVLQSLCIRLGTVSGMDLAQNCRAHLPWYLNWTLYFFAEAAIIATDIAEVIGTAIALNLLSKGKIPLVAGCAISITEVMVILIFYQPGGSMRRLKFFEWCMVGLVLSVVICFCIELSMIVEQSVGHVFDGYVPSAVVASGEGIYLSCGILGATVMPHSLFLGSSVCKPRVRQQDEKIAEERRRLRANDLAASSQATLVPSTKDHDEARADKMLYKPSMAAIKHCLRISTIELIISLCIFALFVNSSILITAGANLYGNESATDADLFSIYDLLTDSISEGAAIVFAVALLLSGISAGIVCTIAGQIVSEGHLNWSIKPWQRQLVIRLLAIIPSIVVAASVGKEGLSAALNGSQVALSVILPFVSAPLVWFTCQNKYMTVGGRQAAANGDETGNEEPKIGMKNHWLVSVLVICIWLFLVIMNVALLVFVGLGLD